MQAQGHAGKNGNSPREEPHRAEGQGGGWKGSEWANQRKPQIPMKSIHWMNTYSVLVARYLSKTMNLPLNLETESWRTILSRSVI